MNFEEFWTESREEFSQKAQILGLFALKQLCEKSFEAGRSEFNIRLPAHKCGLYITHNQHKDVYESISDYIENSKERLNWLSDLSKTASVEADEIWEIQWYPDTPIGFYAVAAPTLNEAIELALYVESCTDSDGE